MTLIQQLSNVAKEIHFNHLSGAVTIKVHITKFNNMQLLIEEYELELDEDKQGNWYFYHGRTGLIF